MAERRIDRDDGVPYTWEEFSTYYTGKYKKKAIEAYWEECKVKKGQGTKAAAAPKWQWKVKAKAKAKTEWKVKADAKPKEAEPKTALKEKLPNLLGASLAKGHVKAVDNLLNEAYADLQKVAEVPQLGSTTQGSVREVDVETELQTQVLRDELGKRCFVVLRDGKILNLSRGCTVLDAAFKIHSEVGLHMLYPEINGKKVSPSHELRNGDRVNIVIDNDAVPQREWLAYAFLRETRKKLSGYFRKPKTIEEWWEEFAAFHREDY